MSQDLSELYSASEKNLAFYFVSNNPQTLGFCLADGLTFMEPDVSTVHFPFE